MTNRQRHGQALKAGAKQAVIFQGANMAVSGAMSKGKTFRPSAIGTGVAAVRAGQAYHGSLKKTKTTVGTKTQGRVEQKVYTGNKPYTVEYKGIFNPTMVIREDKAYKGKYQGKRGKKR